VPGGDISAAPGFRLAVSAPALIRDGGPRQQEYPYLGDIWVLKSPYRCARSGQLLGNQFIFDSSRSLKHHSNFPPMIRVLGRGLGIDPA
jgi:hypothetical protein